MHMNEDCFSLRKDNLRKTGFFKEAVISPLTKLLVKQSRRNFSLGNLCMGVKNFEKSMHMSQRHVVEIPFKESGYILSQGA